MSQYSIEFRQLLMEMADACLSFQTILTKANELHWNKNHTNPAFQVHRCVRIEDFHLLVDLHGLDKSTSYTVIKLIAQRLQGSPLGGIRIVHGKGKGILKKVATEALLNNSSVSGEFCFKIGWFDYIWDKEKFILEFEVRNYDT